MRSATGSFVFTAVLLSACIVACTSAPTQPPLLTTGVKTPSGGGGSSTSGDGGTVTDGGTCAPELGTFAAVTHTATRTAGACTGAQITDAYNACLSPTAATATTCSTWAATTADVACNTCLFVNTSPTGTAWGPVIYYTVGGADFVNYNAGGCVMLENASETAGDCGDQAQALAECINAACDAPCSTTDAEYESCATTAATDSNACGGYTTLYNSACGTSMSSACLSGSNDQTTFTSIAEVFCQ